MRALGCRMQAQSLGFSASKSERIEALKKLYAQFENTSFPHGNLAS
jgi:hypothetical protein